MGREGSAAEAAPRPVTLAHMYAELSDAKAGRHAPATNFRLKSRMRQQRSPPSVRALQGSSSGRVLPDRAHLRLPEHLTRH